jgi:hypothetical protein
VRTLSDAWDIEDPVILKLLLIFFILRLQPSKNKRNAFGSSDIAITYSPSSTPPAPCSRNRSTPENQDIRWLLCVRFGACHGAWRFHHGVGGEARGCHVHQCEYESGAGERLGHSADKAGDADFEELEKLVEC